MSCTFVRIPGSMYKKANVYRMANDTIVRFIELFRSSECLWNIFSEDYGSRLSRNTAYSTISRKMGIPGFGPREVARKIKSLRSAYQREANRIKNTEQNLGSTGSIIRPGVLWFELLNDFLGDGRPEKPGEPHRQSDNQSETASKALSMDTRGRNVNNSSRHFSSYEFSSNGIESSPSSSLGGKKLSAIDTFRDVAAGAAATTTPKERRRKRKEEKADAIEVEEYESFGKYVASNLSRMPFEYAISAETEIHSVIIKYKVYAMRKIVDPTKTTTTMKPKTRTTRLSSSTYLPPSNFYSTLRQCTEETRPCSVDSTENVSD